jgi:1-acylglycerone phosphate reductase
MAARGTARAAAAGGPDALCASSPQGTATDTPLEASRKLFEVNYFGVLAVTQAVAPHMMRRRSGTICNVGSVASWINTPFMASYGWVSPACLHGLAGACRRQGGPCLGGERRGRRQVGEGG